MLSRLFSKNYKNNNKNEAEGRKEQCPNCVNQVYISFDWNSYSNEYISTLQGYRKCKNGMLFQCEKCGTFWFLGNEQTQMESISKTYIDVVLEWDKRSLLPNESVFKKLRSIGATPPDVYGNLKEFVRIPCKCITKDKEEIDFCVVSFQKSPPNYFQRDEGNRIIFVDDVIDIVESEFALNTQVRLATSLAHEVRMCFSPTFVSTPDRKIYILNGITDFFDELEYKGKDITLPSHDVKLSEKESIYYDKSYYKKITWVIADWKDEYCSLRITN